MTQRSENPYAVQHYETTQLPNMPYNMTDWKDMKTPSVPPPPSLYSRGDPIYNIRAPLPTFDAINFIGAESLRPPNEKDLHTVFNGGFDGLLTSTAKISRKEELLFPYDTPNFLPSA